MTDREFLTWLRDRLIHVYGESPNVDCVHRLNAIIAAQPESAATCPNAVCTDNGEHVVTRVNDYRYVCQCGEAGSKRWATLHQFPMENQ